MPIQPTPVVALVSGGLDSMVAAAMMRKAGRPLLALSVNYNQRHQVELAAARRVAQALGASAHVVLPIDLSQFGGSALTAVEGVRNAGGDVQAVAVIVDRATGAAERVADAMAKALIFPDLTCGITAAAGSSAMFTSPDSSAVTAAPEPR